MSKALIITSHVEQLQNVKIKKEKYACSICADGGLIIARLLNLKSDILIGDYDSMEIPKNGNIIKLPMEKDMTDSEAAIDLAVRNGFDFIEVLGGIGGRFDHTMGNIGMLAKYCGKLKHLAFFDGQNYIFMISPGSVKIPKNEYKYLGIIAYGNHASNVTLNGVKYPLTNHLLTNDTTLGVSNEITSEFAEISFTDGKLLIILSGDIDISTGI